MEEKVLTLEQCAELTALGLNMNDASVYWVVNVSNASGKKRDLIPPFLSFHKSTQKVGLESFSRTPTYTLQDILNHFEKYEMVKLKTRTYLQVGFGNAWVHSYDGENELLVAFNVLKWCLENKLL